MYGLARPPLEISKSAFAWYEETQPGLGNRFLEAVDAASELPARNLQMIDDEAMVRLHQAAWLAVAAAISSFTLPSLSNLLLDCGLECLGPLLLLKYGSALAAIGLGLFVRQKLVDDGQKIRDLALIGTVLGAIALVG